MRTTEMELTKPREQKVARVVSVTLPCPHFRNPLKLFAWISRFLFLATKPSLIMIDMEHQNR
jgi:hypothetical protein